MVLSFVLGVIPARGGSKGVKKKNIRPVLGKPLLAHAIRCGRRVTELDRLIVSTDSEEFAEIAREHGAEVPFLRPAPLAADTAPMLPVLEHAILETEKIYNDRVECVVLLDPTGVLRIPADIEGCLKMFRESDCDCVISGHPAHRNPYFNMVTERDGYFNLVCLEGRGVGRRQDAPVCYDLNTVVWIWSRAAVVDQKERLPEKTLLYEIPVERAMDLDHEFDFELLEMILDKKRGQAGFEFFFD